MLCEEIEKAAEAFDLIGRYSRGQVLEAEARGHRALDAGKEMLAVGRVCHTGGHLEESGISLG
jgi:hypothetical protein